MAGKQLRLIFLISAIHSFTHGQGGIGLGESAQDQPSDYNLKFGSLHVDISAFGNVTHDSNFERSSEDQSATVIAAQGLRNRFFWSPSPILSVNSELEVTHIKRSGDASELDGVEIRGGPETGSAQLSTDLRIEDSTVRTYVSYSSGLQEGRIATGPNTETGGNFEQTRWEIGSRYSVQLTPYSRFACGYSYSKSATTTQEFEELELDQHRSSFSLDTQFNASMTAGLFFDQTFSRFDSEQRSDNDSYLSGIRHGWETSWGGQVNTRLGLQYTDITRSGTNEQERGGLRPLFRTELTSPGINGREHQVYFSYSEENSSLVARDDTIAIDSRQEALRTGYRLRTNPRLSWDLELTTDLEQISGATSGTLRRIKFGLNSSHRLGPNWQIALRYLYSKQFDGGERDETFDRHRSSLSASYDF